MRRTWSLAALAAGAALAAPGAAQAGLIDEVKFGAVVHNIRVTDGKNANKESGPVVEAQVNFTSPGVLRIVGAPRPYAVAAVNASGDTSFAAVGLEWRWEFAEGWGFEPGFGYALHDGEVSNPFADGTPQSTAFVRDKVLYGSEDLFRVSFAVTRDFGERWNAQAILLHYSHGQILGTGRNQGVDQLGVRLGYKLGD